MPVTVISTTTIPNTTLGFSSFSPENKALNDTLLQWTESLPGFVSHVFQEHDVGADAKSYSYTVIWETIQDYANYSDAKKDRPEQIVRRAYNEENSINFVVTESIS